ncbi:hypothetical protein P9239_21975 [Caballeronia sp. LZ062]|uniref:hypothetical protein n=1 Tax=unclassified Caballeronia TaxID=2646786 RepID=UPI00286753C6|nr:MULTISPECIES: hypothetical protein [unclassified Caballeronia]MDR5873021.1 hypothetical protein [Caballeronia sp. LZ062]
MLAATAFVASMSVAAHARADAQCPGYVETDGGSAFDVAAIVKDSGSPQSALERVRRAVSKIDAGGGCSIFANVHACEETVTLARKAIVALQACAAGSAPKGTTHG